MISISSLRHSWHNPSGFRLLRPEGRSDYTFVHFTTSVVLYIGESAVEIPEHACIIYSPKTPQHFYCPNGIIHDWIHFTNAPNGFLSSLNIPTDALFYPKKWSFITDIVEEMENEFYAKRDCCERLLDLKFTELFIKISRCLGEDSLKEIDKKSVSELRLLRARVAKSLNLDWTVEKMAKELALSKSRFSHLYHAFYATSPIDDLIRMKISASKSALAFTQNPITEIAFSLGYKNATHFSRQFQKHVGISPSQYRKRNQLKSDDVPS